jgi:hypothetical protein
MFLSKNKYLYAWAAVFFFYLTLNSCSYSKHSSRQLLKKARSEGPYDLIIVPGVPLQNGKWDYVMKGRVYWSKYLYDQGIARNIMYSGSAVYTPYYEAEVMALYAIAIGIDPKHVFTETKAEHSTENLYYSFHKARKMGFKKIALASDAGQTKLLSVFAVKKVDSSIAMIPMQIDTMKALRAGFIDPVIDYQQAAATNFVALPKRQSLRERLRGTRGLKIDVTAYK